MGIPKALRELAEYHQSYSDEPNDIEAQRALTCRAAASMIESMSERINLKESSDGRVC